MNETKTCPFCKIAEGDGGPDAGIVFQDEHWLVRTISPTPAVAGWLLLQARRHITDSAEPNAAKAAVQHGLNPARPPHWGGYRLVPDRYEFWQGRRSRLHDRLVFTRDADRWVRERLAP